TIVERRESGDQGHAERFLARDAIAAQNPPSPLSVADSRVPGEFVNGDAKFDSFDEDFVGQQLGQLYGARSSEIALRAITDVGPAFQENAKSGRFSYCIQAAL